MPQLKQLSCCIQWSDTGAPFQEHGTLYGDGVVETFIIVPNKPQGFSIRLTSRGFICEGLVMIVFIDGDYQCNRSRVNLLPPAKDHPANRTEIDFLLRQREKSQGDGLYLGREWRFDNHNIVPETPAGFQESHFDNLGVIEVLVLRCRARNREDAEYEGSSSGEDSDVFEDRPPVEEQKEPSTASAPAPQASAAPELPTEEDEGMGFIGLFDGANDLPDPPAYDGGNDIPPGRWIWHQSRPPFAGFPEPPQYHQPEGYRFRSQSYAQPPFIPHPQPCHDRRSYSGQMEKKVHFDDRRPEQQQQDMHGRFSQIHQPQPQRPASRVRERRPSRTSQAYPIPSYDPQRIDQPSHGTEWHDAQENQDQRQPSRLSYHGDPRYSWGYGNGNSAHTNNGRASHPERPNNHNQSQSLQDQGRNNGQQPEQRQSFIPRQDNGSEPASTVNSRPPPPTSATNQGPSAQSMQYDAQAMPSRNPSEQIRQPTYPEPSYATTHPRYPQHAEPSNETLNHPTPSPYVPVYPHHPYPYPQPPQTTHGYHYPQVPYPGYWPVHGPQNYDPNQAQMYPGRPAEIIIHPPHMNHPRSDEQVSPTNIHGYSGDYPDPNGGHNHTGPGQEGYGGSQGGPQDAGGSGGVSESFNNNSPNNANDSNWANGGGNTENGAWGQDTNHANSTGDNNNQENATDGYQNDKPDAGDTNQENHDWDNNRTSGNNDNTWDNDNSGNNNNNNWDSNANNTQAANNSNGWDAPAASNNGGGSVAGNSRSPTADTGILPDVPRDLYGPHGPYYALRGIRLSEPRPDAEEEPRFDVPKSLAMARGSTKQVQPGPGYRYYKKSIVPEYIDTLENPYARFVFKYRTKDQLLNEIGIEVDVEPTGDAEIQDLQNLDKQALIEMLVRAKSALGGKVPSPPPTPSASGRGSEVNAPVAIDAPKNAYLKYSLPPLRPNNINSAKSSSSAAKPEPRQNAATSRKENDAGWNNQNNNNSGGDWNNTGNNNTTNSGNWANNAGGWDGTSAKNSVKSAKSSTRSTGSRRSQDGGASGSMRQGQMSWSGVGAGSKDAGPRPSTPNGIPPQKDPAEDNWDQAAEPSGGW